MVPDAVSAPDRVMPVAVPTFSVVVAATVAVSDTCAAAVQDTVPCIVPLCTVIPAPVVLVSAAVPAVIDTVPMVRVAAVEVDTDTVPVVPHVSAGTFRLVPASANVVVRVAVGPSTHNQRGESTPGKADQTRIHKTCNPHTRNTDVRNQKELCTKRKREGNTKHARLTDGARSSNRCHTIDRAGIQSVRTSTSRVWLATVTPVVIVTSVPEFVSTPPPPSVSDVPLTVKLVPSDTSALTVAWRRQYL